MFNQETYKKLLLQLPEGVQLMGVTKNKPKEDLISAIGFGMRLFGENYVFEAKEKHSALKSLFVEKGVSFHLIGHLQSNKAFEAASIFDCIQTIDSEKIARKIDSSCKELGKKIEVMIEVNFGEVQKSGVPLSELPLLVEKVNKFENLNLTGLMCVPPIGKEKEVFLEMHAQKQKFSLKELSIGMSSDYKLAIEYGSTMVRIGTLLFGEREK